MLKLNVYLAIYEYILLNCLPALALAITVRDITHTPRTASAIIIFCYLTCFSSVSVFFCFFCFRGWSCLLILSRQLLFFDMPVTFQTPQHVLMSNASAPAPPSIHKLHCVPVFSPHASLHLPLPIVAEIIYIFHSGRCVDNSYGI